MDSRTKRTITIQDQEKPVYEIAIRKDYSDLKEFLHPLELSGHRMFIITDSAVGERYGKEVEEALRPLCSGVDTFVFPAGEESKNLDTVREAYRFLIEKKCDRKDYIVALGGGVVGDLAGYTAATYLRGISFIQMPTSLLAMVDSSIGGKTGVDFDAYKNMVGAFHQPKAVYMNLSVLKTLSETQYRSGFAEVIKHGLLEDRPLYDWMRSHAQLLLDRDLEALETMIYESCLDKKRIVESDPLEKGERALLNLGHTIGHAVEKLMDFRLLHGECVSIGTAAAGYLSWRRGWITEEEYNEILATMESYHLPVKIQNLDPKEILQVSKSDKKMERGKIKFILLEQIGRAVMRQDVTDEEMEEAINSILV